MELVAFSKVLCFAIAFMLSTIVLVCPLFSFCCAIPLLFFSLSCFLLLQIPTQRRGGMATPRINVVHPCGRRKSFRKVERTRSSGSDSSQYSSDSAHSDELQVPEMYTTTQNWTEHDGVSIVRVATSDISSLHDPRSPRSLNNDNLCTVGFSPYIGTLAQRVLANLGIREFGRLGAVNDWEEFLEIADHPELVRREIPNVQEQTKFLNYLEKCVSILEDSQQNTEFSMYSSNLFTLLLEEAERIGKSSRSGSSSNATTIFPLRRIGTSLTSLKSSASRNSIKSEAGSISSCTNDTKIDAIINYGEVIQETASGRIQLVNLDFGFGQELVEAVVKIIRMNENISEVDAGRELRCLSIHPHPNIISIFGSFNEGGCKYVIMEYCKNGDLFKAKKRMTIAQKLNAIREIISGMKFLHKNGIVHRDLKPQNVLLAEGDVCKIGDFGHSLTNSSKKVLESCIGSFGTVEYLAPESVEPGLLSTEKEEDGKLSRFEQLRLLDIYSFGITIWEILSSKQPFLGIRKKNNNRLFQMMVHIHANQCRPDLNDIEVKGDEKEVKKIERLKELMKMCWKTNPYQRPRSFEDIEKFLADGETLSNQVDNLDEGEEFRRDLADRIMEEDCCFSTESYTSDSVLSEEE